jgi:pantoate--beta-alanine ligase
MVTCLIGLGSNLGDRVGNLLAAIALLRQDPAISLQAVSSFVESAPVGGPEEQPYYFNGAATLATSLPAELLLERLLAVESKLGRVRGERFGPRTIDLDLLLYGEQIIETSTLQVPHPRLCERRFVLAPAAEIAGPMRVPTISDASGSVSIVALADRLPPPALGELGLRVITSTVAIERHVREVQRSGRRVGVVPTMGALHAGHLSLVHEARQRSDYVVATIFVNPTQFAPHEDLTKYPRTLDADLAALSEAGCHAAFVPAVEEMYPHGATTMVDPPEVAKPLEGECRPGHFRGVATIVLKLFHLIPADVACFGQKDFQQALVIRRMVADLNVPIEVVVCPTVREADGLALSSRNRYLSAAEREQALALSRALRQAEQSIHAGETESNRIISAVHETLAAAGITSIDYVALADPETLAEVPRVEGKTVALIACQVGSTRLIDNCLLDPTIEAGSANRGAARA